MVVIPVVALIDSRALVNNYYFTWSNGSSRFVHHERQAFKVIEKLSLTVPLQV